jgi:hypothetical protein
MRQTNDSQASELPFGTSRTHRIAMIILLGITFKLSQSPAGRNSPVATMERKAGVIKRPAIHYRTIAVSREGVRRYGHTTGDGN